jgi:hypothetical protein
VTKLTKWTWIGSPRSVYVRGDVNRTAFVEVKRDGSWELLSHPIGYRLQRGTAYTTRGAKQRACTALLRFLRQPYPQQSEQVEVAENGEARAQV